MKNYPWDIYWIILILIFYLLLAKYWYWFEHLCPCISTALSVSWREFFMLNLKTFPEVLIGIRYNRRIIYTDQQRLLGDLREVWISVMWLECAWDVCCGLIALCRAECSLASSSCSGGSVWWHSEQLLSGSLVCRPYGQCVQCQILQTIPHPEESLDGEEIEWLQSV